mgnify:CR=1 FL=1|tara:strand:+ start:8500 stop:8883 length:384 start_codon:yes stop_codon:yes gene_type:complete
MSEIKTNKLTGTSTAKTVTVTVGATATQSLEQGSLKCWVFADNGATVGDSLNISSGVDDGGNGQYTYNLTNAFNTVSYSVVLTPMSSGAVFGIVWSHSVSQWRTRWYNTSGTYTNTDNAYVLAGDLA